MVESEAVGTTGSWRIPLTRPSVGEEELEAVRHVFESGMLTEGEETRKFEEEFARLVGSRYAIATSSGTTALHLALLCVGVKRGHEVILPDFTFPATGNVVFHCGAKPVLCDINLEEYQIAPDFIDSLISHRTKVIVPVSEFGLTAELFPIMETAVEHNLRIVEDAAPALGSFRYMQHAGTFGDMGCFSFHPRKPCAIGEGGMIVTDNEELAEKARSLKNHGRSKDKWQFASAGYNYRLSDVHSAIGRVQLGKLGFQFEARRKHAMYYNEKLRDKVAIPYEPNNCIHTYQSYVVLLHKPAAKVIHALRVKGIETQIGTNCLHILEPFKNVRRGNCDNAFRAWQCSVTLPLFEGITFEQQDEVVEELCRLL